MQRQEHQSSRDLAGQSPNRRAADARHPSKCEKSPRGESLRSAEGHPSLALRAACCRLAPTARRTRISDVPCNWRSRTARSIQLRSSSLGRRLATPGILALGAVTSLPRCPKRRSLHDRGSVRCQLVADGQSTEFHLTTLICYPYSATTSASRWCRRARLPERCRVRRARRGCRPPADTASPRAALCAALSAAR